MKNKILLLAIVTVATVGNVWSQTGSNAQNISEEGKSNGTIEIVALYVPDFVAFRPAKGKECKEWETWFISEKGDSIRSFLTKGLRLNIEMKDGNMQAICTDKSEVHALFNIQDNFFKASKIKFIIDKKEMFYNLADGGWE